uniref:Uncharacterized protein n=1 Tax=Aureoumbra lagunensis TaxID=44058 RepID=A0A7S3K352_9STRA|mmetsp:Transcript_26322/g.33159  ORF Transcript_26322/g.33159 Transcript_26322/m.33159 type:complete len:235 (+) Transcript_26322:3-707(+)
MTKFLKRFKRRRLLYVKRWYNNIENRKNEKDEIDLWKILGVKRYGDEQVYGGRSRCFRRFHQRAVNYDIEKMRKGDIVSTSFRRLCLAFVVLIDDARREIYSRSGISALRASENYHVINVFELDPIEIFDRFFNAQDPITGQPSQAIREYLLLEAASSSKENDSDDEDAYIPPPPPEHFLPSFLRQNKTKTLFVGNEKKFRNYSLLPTPINRSPLLARTDTFLLEEAKKENGIS